MSKEEYETKETYTAAIMKMVNQINSLDILNYIYLIVDDIRKEDGGTAV